MENRFQSVEAPSLKELLAELNKRSGQYWFTVVYMSNEVAVIDTAVNLCQSVEEEEFTELQMGITTPSPSFA